MGGKPCKPVVSFEKAEAALCSDGVLNKEKIRKVFEDAVKSDGRNEVSNSPLGSSPSQTETLKLKLSINTFREKFEFANAVFELGDKVVERLFKVLGADDDALDYESFVCSVYIFAKSTKQEKQRLIFNMFDFNGSGFIKKKEFRDMTVAIIRGDTTPPEFDTDFKPLSKLMTDSAMALYDTNRDGKLSFEEWLKYSENDQDVQRCFMALSRGCELSSLLKTL